MPTGTFHEYRLDLGGTIIAFRCEPAPFSAYLCHWFDRPSSLAAPHADIQLELVPHPESVPLPNTLLQTKTALPQGGFDISDGLLRGNFDQKSRQGRILANADLARGQLMRVMEQIFYQTFFSARKASGLDSWLVHSSAVIAGGKGFLFVGPSEAGKTTAADNSQAHHVLGDEMNLVHFTDKGIMLEGTPFNGTYRQKQPGSAPLAAVFLLNQAPDHGLEEVGSAEAGSILAAEIVPPVGLDEIPDPGTVPLMVETAGRIIGQVPVQRLNLKPDPGFWSVIARQYDLGLD